MPIEEGVEYASNGITQKDSEGLRSTQKDSEALRRTQKHYECSKQYLENLLPEYLKFEKKLNYIFHYVLYENI